MLEVRSMFAAASSSSMSAAAEFRAQANALRSSLMFAASMLRAQVTDFL
jgi:hypothetical protein